jgi:putative alpha-1,2-mannosidase
MNLNSALEAPCSITINLNSTYYKGKQFVIETVNNSPENYYIGSMSVNGTDLTKTFVPFSTVINGGRMIIRMDNVPKNNY